MPNYLNGKIYIIQNTKNEKVYIGSTTQLLKYRFSNHLRDVFINKKQYSLTKPINTLGAENFSIELLEEYPCNSKKELENIEEYWIGFFIEVLGRDKVYNSKINKTFSQETKNKMSILNTGSNNPRFNRGSLYKNKENNRYIYQYYIYKDGLKERIQKSFSFNKYGGEENASKEAEKFRDIMFPPNEIISKK
jgi:group I intron endonuclease